MARNEKADLRGIGSDEKSTTANRKGFFNSHYRHFGDAVQCKFCGSDYMRFAIDGYCQRCQQRAEYVIREHSRVLPHSYDSAGSELLQLLGNCTKKPQIIIKPGGRTR